jgi:3-deoxy-manno-octulosonate cytidylyltransferase (CMP-KDO synthetase)
MRSLIVIPARYGSTRLPGKPLLRSTGKYLIQHVYERARQARQAGDVVVATDDSRIVAAVESFGGYAVRTRRDHPSGTDRVAEVARSIYADIYVNLQGDEPQFEPAGLDALIDQLAHNPEAGMATLAAPLDCEDSYRDPNCVKVVCDASGRALIFSRSPIPFVRNGQPNFSVRPAQFLQHIGIYAYRRDTLVQLTALPPSPLEKAEKLEQLRALTHGIPIQVGIVTDASRGVDTFDDYRRFVRQWTRRSACARDAA